MNRMTRLAAGIALATSAIATATPALAEVSYNVGYVSEYHYRGIFQKNSSASAGIDYEEGGFYVGAWTADVGDGLEVDGYFGYGIEMDSGLSLSAGFTGYYYTGEFDDTYQELNLGIGYSIASLDYAYGEYDNFGGPTQDYDFLSLGVELENGIYGTYGTFGQDADGSYVEIGYGTTVSDIDLGVSFIFADDTLSDQADAAGNPKEAQSLVFSIGKSF